MGWTIISTTSTASSRTHNLDHEIERNPIIVVFFKYQWFIHGKVRIEQKLHLLAEYVCISCIKIVGTVLRWLDRLHWCTIGTYYKMINNSNIRQTSKKTQLGIVVDKIASYLHIQLSKMKMCAEDLAFSIQHIFNKICHHTCMSLPYNMLHRHKCSFSDSNVLLWNVLCCMMPHEICHNVKN